jgi:DUF4097 and DUF4098 domain-containing protein YvlB
MNKPMNCGLRTTLKLSLIGAALALLSAAQIPLARAQGTNEGDHLTLHLSDPSRPAHIKASLINGGITVKAYDGKDVLIEAHAREREPVRTENGMHRLSVTSTGLAAQEENNEVRIDTDSFMRPVDLVITVPVHTSLSLHTVNDGNISVAGVDGDIDVEAINGAVTLDHVSGSVVAHAVNGRVNATFVRVNSQKPMAFSTLNGEIDVTFPADFKANLNLHSMRGDILSDFDVQLNRAGGQPIVEDSGSTSGRYRVRTDGSIHATINGGGQDIQFSTLNGNIYIRRAGAAR